MGRVRRRGWHDPNGPHIRVYHHLMNSPAWLALSGSGIRLWLDMRLKLTSYNNGNIEAVFSILRHRGWRSKTTLHKALRELEAAGFIVQTRQGGIACMSRICSLYRFTDQDAPEQEKQRISASKATHDYRRFHSIREAHAAIQAAEANRNQGLTACRKKSKVQKLELTRPDSGPMTAAKPEKAVTFEPA